MQLEHLLKLKEDLGRPGGYDRLAGRLEELAARLPYQHGTVLCLTGREKSLADARGAAIDLLDSLKPRDHLPPSPRRWNETEPQGNHALLVGPNTNNNIASQARVSVDGSALAAVQVLNRYLLIEVRMKGGAYGAYAEVDQVEGVLELSSYRDPNLEDTLSVFRGAAAELRRVASDMDPDRLESAILGGLRDLQAYDPPADRGYQALIRFLRNTSVASMQAQRDELFETKPSQLADLADAMDDAVFVTVAAAPEDQARGVVNPDGTPFFVKLIDADAYFRDS